MFLSNAYNFRFIIYAVRTSIGKFMFLSNVYNFRFIIYAVQTNIGKFMFLSNVYNFRFIIYAVLTNIGKFMFFNHTFLFLFLNNSKIFIIFALFRMRKSNVFYISMGLTVCVNILFFTESICMTNCTTRIKHRKKIYCMLIKLQHFSLCNFQKFHLFIFHYYFCLSNFIDYFCSS